jgi:hypothetical protein
VEAVEEGPGRGGRQHRRGAIGAHTETLSTHHRKAPSPQEISARVAPEHGLQFLGAERWQVDQPRLTEWGEQRRLKAKSSRSRALDASLEKRLLESPEPLPQGRPRIVQAGRELNWDGEDGLPIRQEGRDRVRTHSHPDAQPTHQ